MLTMFTYTSCSLSSRIAKVDKVYEAGEYKEAADDYRKVIRKVPKKQRKLKGALNYKLADCYAHINAPDKAARAYKAAVRFKYTNEDIYLKMAKAEHASAKYKDARANYAKHLEEHPNSMQAQNGLIAMDSILKWNKHKTRHKVRLSRTFNFRRTSNFSLMFSDEDAQVALISSNRGRSKDKKNSAITGVPSNDIYITRKNKSGKWEELEKIEGKINTLHDEGAVSFSPDGKTMYFTRCEVGYEAARIFKSQRSGGEWTEPQYVPLFKDSLISTGHPAISSDGNVMYFISDAKGGFGENDIWYSMYVDGQWAEPINAGVDINTAGNEMFPYMDRKGQLFFSSDGHAGYGGLDLYCAVNDSLENWTVRNMKAPFNTRFDDFGIVFEGNTDNGYFSSNRNQKKFIDQIYRFDLPKMFFTIEGNVVNQEEDKLSDGIIRLVGDNGDNVKIKARKNGSYKIDLRRGVKYVMMASHKGYLNSSHQFETYGLIDSKEFEHSFVLSSLTKAVKMNNIFYEFGKWTLTPQSEKGLKDLVKMMNDNPNIVIEISAHTDMVGNDASNIELSQKRAQSVVNYLLKAGIHTDRVVPKGYGESKPVVVTKRMSRIYKFLREGTVLNEAFIETLTEKQQELCNKINRRTEFKVIRTTYNLY